LPGSPARGTLSTVSEQRQDFRQVPRGPLVEFVRLIIVASLAAAGYGVAKQGGSGTGRIVIGIILGSAVGYVAGGVVGRGHAPPAWAGARSTSSTRARSWTGGCSSSSGPGSWAGSC